MGQLIFHLLVEGLREKGQMNPRIHPTRKMTGLGKVLRGHLSGPIKS